MGHQPRNTDRRHHPNPPAAPQQRTNNSLNFKQLLCKAETHQQLCGRAKTQLTQHYDDMHLMARQQPPGSDSADAFGACDNFLVRHRATKNQVPKCRRRRYLPQPYRQAKAAQMSANSLTPKHIIHSATHQFPPPCPAAFQEQRSSQRKAPMAALPRLKPSTAGAPSPAKQGGYNAQTMHPIGPQQTKNGRAPVRRTDGRFQITRRAPNPMRAASPPSSGRWQW